MKRTSLALYPLSGLKVDVWCAILDLAGEDKMLEMEEQPLDGVWALDGFMEQSQLTTRHSSI